jgi:hypothetical protein
MLVGWVRRAERAFMTTNLVTPVMFKVTYRDTLPIYHIYRKDGISSIEISKVGTVFAFASLQMVVESHRQHGI